MSDLHRWLETARRTFGRAERQFIYLQAGFALAAILGLFASALFGVFPGQIKTHEPIAQQLARLSDAEATLKELSVFVRDQQAQLRNTQSVLQELRSEHERLKPVVEADRNTVEAILAANAHRQELSVWWERCIGFVSGTVASLIAAVIWAFASRLWRKRVSLNNVP